MTSVRLDPWLVGEMTSLSASWPFGELACMRTTHCSQVSDTRPTGTSRVLCRNVDQRNELPVQWLVHPGERAGTRAARECRTSWRRLWWRQAGASFSPSVTSLPVVRESRSTLDDWRESMLQVACLSTHTHTHTCTHLNITSTGDIHAVKNYS